MTSAYSIDTSVRFGPLELIDIDRVRREMTGNWSNRTLGRINDCVVRLGVVQGEFHWHKHDEEDEFFYVIDGKFHIELADAAPIELAPGQAFTVPRGVMHRTSAPVRTTILMVEGASVVPTGDA